jgi:2-polyprenyl-3-methyl-5-hydroxy-6-metoxy-1,4-benzoquinol methylase
VQEAVNNCPLCGCDQSSLFDRRKFRGFEVVNVLCKNCGLVYQTPRMTAAELENFYQEKYREIYQGSEGPNEQDLMIQNARAKYLVRLIEDMGIEEIGRYVDIGSSAGLLMEEIQNAYNCFVAGIEPGAAYREYAQERGLTIYTDLNQLLENEPRKFDLVSMIHVLEHVSRPVDYVRHLRSDLLSKNARLLIEVPNLYAHECFEVAHLSSFSQDTLTQLLKKAGFRILYIERHGFPRSKLIPLYITALAEPDEEKITLGEVEGERLVGLKRRTGFLHRRIIERLLPDQAWVPQYRS